MLLATMLSGQPASGAGGEADCRAERIDAWVTSHYVYDGDTLRLSDGRNVRLIGVNAPEIGRDGAASDPLAERSRQFLGTLTPPGSQVGLRYGNERTDRYGRTLAHLFLAPGGSVQARMLDAGLAVQIVVPPNTRLAPCYADREAGARRAKIGMWALRRYQAVDARELRATDRGFRLVRGTVQRVGQGRKNWWLNLAPGMAVRVPKRDLEYFDDFRPERLVGRRVETRGWITLRNGELRVTVRHPAALVVLK